MLAKLFVLIAILHGLIHIMGFAKAFGYGEWKQLTLPISKVQGVVWLLCSILFLIVSALLIQKKDEWIYLAWFATLISQVLILWVWQDAKFGTLANLVVFLVALLSFTSLRFEKSYLADVAKHRSRVQGQSQAIVTESEVARLPAPVQRYLRWSGVVGRPKPFEMFVKFKGRMRSKERDWFSFTAEQHNFFDVPTRLFFMKAEMFGITVPGYHRYENENAEMVIRLFGFVPVVQVSGKEMSRGETVTLLNDMCLMAPASLLDPRLRWEPLDQQRAKLTFTNGNIQVSAVLYVDDEGRLTNFTSEDRFEVNLRQFLPFSTPVTAHQKLNDLNVLAHGQAVWHYGQEAFVYGEFDLLNIDFDSSKAP